VHVTYSDLDELTGLPNRRAMRDCLVSELTQRGLVGALLFDIRDVRWLNDHYGHLAVDQLIATVGRRLGEAAHDGDLVARVGGDEFMLLAPSVGADEDDLAALGQELEHAIAAEPVRVATRNVSMSVTYKGAMLKDPEDLRLLG
jgi:diguanylate cyclase (GGDEF)-like protein